MIITFTTPPHPKERVVVNGDLALIGRPSPDWNIEINLANDTAVSRLHAAIAEKDGEFWVEDLGSTNGTRVNGKKISQKTLLPPGTHVLIGSTIIEVERDKPTPRPGPAGTDIHGDIAEKVDAGLPPFITLRDSPSTDALEAAMRQLQALHDVGRALGSAESIDEVFDILKDQVQRAVPAAQRGAVLLRDDHGKLLLKTHWPAGHHSVSMTWANSASEQRQAFIWSADQQSEQDIPKTALYYKVQAAIYAPLIWDDEVFGVVYVDSYADREAFQRADLDLLRTIAEQTAMFIRIHTLQDRLRGEERLQASLLSQFSPHVVSRLLQEKGEVRLGGQRADPVTVLMADVRGFTALSAKLEPDVLVQMLNEMYSAFIPIVFRYEGTVDKYEGDLLLAVFGSPEPDDQQWQKAIAAALEIHRAQAMLSKAWQVRGLPGCEMGIGIHTGAVIYGFVGSAERMEFTVIGEAVNRASRVTESAAGGEVVISQAVYEHVYRRVNVSPTSILGKHADTEGEMQGYVVHSISDDDMDVAAAAHETLSG